VVLGSTEVNRLAPLQYHFTYVYHRRVEKRHCVPLCLPVWEGVRTRSAVRSVSVSNKH
jgi:hypothetical protein